MVQEAVSDVPPRGTLLRRAHELLESMGQPTPEDLLIKHLFGVESAPGKHAMWTMLLRQTLQGSSLFEQTDESRWMLAAWKSTQLLLDEVEFVVLDTETTGLRPGGDRVIEVAAFDCAAAKCWIAFKVSLILGVAYRHSLCSLLALRRRW